MNRPHILPSNVCVVLRRSPEAAPADSFVPVFLPVPALLAGPGLSPLARSIQEHIGFRLSFVGLASNGIPWAIVLNEQVFESLRECLTATDAPPEDLIRTVEAIGCNHAARLLAAHSECLDRNSPLPNIPNCPGRMVIAIECLQFLSRYCTVLKDMVYDCPGPLSRHLVTKRKNRRSMD